MRCGPGSVLLALTLSAAVADARASDAPAGPPAPAASAGEPTFDSIGIAQGLTSSTIFSVLVDRHGFVWFCGDSGVHRYDGRGVHTFDREPDQRHTLLSRRNVALADTGDAIWIQGFGGVLQRLDAATGRFTEHALSRADGRKPGARALLLADPADRLWIGTDIGLYTVAPGAATAAQVTFSDDANAPVTALALDSGGHHVLVGSGRKVHALALGEPAAGPAVFELAAEEQAVVLAIAPWRDRTWLATDRGLYLQRGNGRTVERVALPGELSRERIDALVVGRDGVLWFGGVQRNGLARYDPVRGTATVHTRHPDDPYSLKSERINALALDRNDNLWIGLLRDGANRLHVGAQGVARFRAPPDRSNSFCATHELPDGRLLVALCGGSVGILDPRSGAFEDRRAEIDRALAFPTPTLNSHAIVPDGDDGYWLPAALLGLVHWQPASGTARLYPLRAHDGRLVPPVFLPDALRDRAGRVWVASRSGLARLVESERELRLLDPETPAGKLFAGGTIDLAELSDGRLWVGTSSGLVRFDPASGRGERHAHDVDDRATLSDDTVLAVHVEPDGTSWFGTPAGLNRMTGEVDGVPRFRRYGTAEGLPDQSIWAIGNDAHGALWVGTNRGIARLDREGDRFRAFIPGDGVPDSNVNKQALYAARDGSLYVGTFSGLLRLDPAAFTATVAQPVMLGAYEIGGARHVNLRGPAVDALSTTWEQAHVRFEIAAFGDPRRLSYRLSGLESRWHEMPGDLVVGYDPLPAGDYVFEVRQMDAHSAWLQPAVALPLSVSPPPWRSGVAYALYALALLGALAIALVASARRRADDARHLAELGRLASYDALTGLPNRARFGELLEAALRESHVALFFIDLDRFKNINDSLGHRFGDRLLVAAAERLREALPASASLARIGGDEFTAVLPQLRREMDAAGAARKVLDAFATPLKVDGYEVVVTLSLGISLAPAHAQEGAALVQYADSAMYFAKESGRNTYRFFQPRMVAQVTRRLALECGLRLALEHGEFHLVYQPKISLASGRICGAEVLLRWTSPEHGVVEPVEFVPILEDTGLIEPVGLWVMQQVCELSQRWHLAGRPMLPLSVNISVHQLIRGDLCERIAQLLVECGVPRDTIELELTETAVMENAEQMDAALRELRELGLGLSIDDFGTGYSSFAHLSHLPVDKLKIDRRFVEAVGLSEQADTLCAAIIAMAHNLKLVVVAEGVETALQHERLVAMECDEAQGFWYSVPLRVPELESFVDEHRELDVPGGGSKR